MVSQKSIKVGGVGVGAVAVSLLVPTLSKSAGGLSPANSKSVQLITTVVLLVVIWSVAALTIKTLLSQRFVEVFDNEDMSDESKTLDLWDSVVDQTGSDTVLAQQVMLLNSKLAANERLKDFEKANQPSFASQLESRIGTVGGDTRLTMRQFFAETPSDAKRVFTTFTSIDVDGHLDHNSQAIIVPIPKFAPVEASKDPYWSAPVGLEQVTGKLFESWDEDTEFVAKRFPTETAPCADLPKSEMSSTTSSMLDDNAKTSETNDYDGITSDVKQESFDGLNKENHEDEEYDNSVDVALLAEQAIASFKNKGYQSEFNERFNNEMLLSVRGASTLAQDSVTSTQDEEATKAEQVVSVLVDASNLDLAAKTDTRSLTYPQLEALVASLKLASRLGMDSKKIRHIYAYYSGAKHLVVEQFDPKPMRMDSRPASIFPTFVQVGVRAHYTNCWTVDAEAEAQSALGLAKTTWIPLGQVDMPTTEKAIRRAWKLSPARSGETTTFRVLSEHAEVITSRLRWLLEQTHDEVSVTKDSTSVTFRLPEFNTTIVVQIVDKLAGDDHDLVSDDVTLDGVQRTDVLNVGLMANLGRSAFCNGLGVADLTPMQLYPLVDMTMHLLMSDVVPTKALLADWAQEGTDAGVELINNLKTIFGEKLIDGGENGWMLTNTRSDVAWLRDAVDEIQLRSFSPAMLDSIEDFFKHVTPEVVSWISHLNTLDARLSTPYASQIKSQLQRLLGDVADLAQVHGRSSLAELSRSLLDTMVED